MSLTRLTATAGLALLLVSGTAFAQDGGMTGGTSEMEAVFACKTKADPIARLACFDAAVGQLQTAQDTGAVVTISKAEVEKVERDAFGFSIPSLGGLGNLFGGGNDPDKAANKAARKMAKDKLRAEAVTSVTSRIVKVGALNNDRYRFYLENGQVWTQTDTDTFRKPRKDNGVWPTVTIEKGALGSFKLQYNGKGRSMRVKRTG